MGRTEELSDFQPDTIIGCHLSNKSVHQISALRELPWSIVRVVIVKWKCLGEKISSAAKWSTTQAHRTGPPSAEASAWHGKIVCHQLQHSLPSSKLNLEAMSAQALWPKVCGYLRMQHLIPKSWALIWSWSPPLLL